MAQLVEIAEIPNFSYENHRKTHSGLDSATHPSQDVDAPAWRGSNSPGREVERYTVPLVECSGGGALVVAGGKWTCSLLTCPCFEELNIFGLAIFARKNTRINEIYVQMQPGKELLHLLPFLKRSIFYCSNLPTYESEAGSSAFDSCEVTCIEKK